MSVFGYQHFFLLLCIGVNILLTIKSGLRTPIAEIPTPDFAVPYAAPKHVKTMAEVHPITPKKGYILVINSSATLIHHQSVCIYIYISLRRFRDAS